MLIDALARTPGTLLQRQLTREEWTLDQHLLAVAVDALRAANWQRAGRKANRPRPISPLARRGQSKKVGGGGGRTPEQTMALLHGYRTGAFDRSGG